MADTMNEQSSLGRFLKRFAVIRLWPLPLRVCWCNLWALFYPESDPNKGTFGLEVSWNYHLLLLLGFKRKRDARELQTGIR